MIYILFATVLYNGNVASFTHDFKNKLDCETALHNMKMQLVSTSKQTVNGFCQEAKK